MSGDIIKDIAEDIKRVANLLCTDTLGRSEYYLHGKYSHYQLYDDGRNWTELCELAGVTPKTSRLYQMRNIFEI